MTILFLNLQITRSDIRPHMKWVVSLVIAYGHFNLPQGFVWVCMGQHTHFIAPKGRNYNGYKPLAKNVAHMKQKRIVVMTYSIKNTKNTVPSV